MEDVIVHPRVCERHPELSEQDVLAAWQSCLRARIRLDKSPNEYIAVGADGNGRLVEMAVKSLPDGSWLIYHAMTPPSKKTLSELDLIGGKHG